MIGIDRHKSGSTSLKTEQGLLGVAYCCVCGENANTDHMGSHLLHSLSTDSCLGAAAEVRLVERLPNVDKRLFQSKLKR